MRQPKITRTRSGNLRLEYPAAGGRPAMVRYRRRVDVEPKGSTRRTQKMVTAPTEAELKAKIARLQVNRDDGRPPPSKITVAEVVDRYLAVREVKPATMRQYRDSVSLWTQRIGDVRAAQLTEEMIVDTRRSLLASGRRSGGRAGTALTPRTVNAGLVILRAAFRREVNAGRLSRNPAAEPSPRGRRSRRHRPGITGDQVWTAEELAAFARVARRDRLAVAWELAMLGLRRGEVAGLRWGEVDLAGATLRVAWTRTLTDNASDESVPKTEGSERELALTPVVVDALAGATRGRPCELCGQVHVVVDELGRPVLPAALSYRFGKIVADAGVRPIRLHDLRHTVATLALADGESIVNVSRWLGHADASFTLRTYAGWVPDTGAAMRNVAARLGRLAAGDGP